MVAEDILNHQLYHRVSTLYLHGMGRLELRLCLVPLRVMRQHETEADPRLRSYRLDHKAQTRLYKRLVSIDD